MRTNEDQAGDPLAHDQRRRRRIGWWLGAGLVAAGFALVGYVGWQLWGTTWVSHRKQENLTQQLERAWHKPRAQRCEPGQVKLGQASALVRIPRFGKSYVVPVLEGVSEDVLARGFGHFTRSADPGQRGNYAIAAHRVTHGEPLRQMPELRAGDHVIVETAGATYVYVLDTNPNDLVVDFTQGWVLDPLPHNPHGGVQPKQVAGRRLITLTTCSELFHTDHRMIAFGHLVKAVPRP